MFKRCILLVGVASTLGGCAAPVRVTVESMAAPEAVSKKDYVLLSGMKGVDYGDLEFRTFAAQVNQAMVAKGFRHVQAGEAPSIAVALSYYVSDPTTTTQTDVIPQFGQTGYSSASTFGSVGAGGTFSSQTTLTPAYGITGYTPVTSQKVAFGRGLYLNAYDFAKMAKNQMEEVWKASAFSMGDSGSMQAAFPDLLEALAPYIGTSTPERNVMIQKPL